jgi:ParB/RepB/Spo0J family partition protein
MPHEQTKESPLEQIHEVPLRDIDISDDNVRVSEAIKDLDELAASIKRHGLLQPVVLLGDFGKPPYKVISGQRRFLAHKQILKTNTIKAVFVGNISKTEAVIRSLVENLQRLELEYEDTAKAVTHLYEEFDKDERKVQKETGLSIQKIREFILVQARATPKMKALLRSHKVSPVDVKRAIRASQDNLKKAEELIDLIIEYKPTAHQKRRLVAYGQGDKSASPKHILTEAMKPHVEQNLIVSLPEDVRKALTAATKSLSMEPEELTTKVLTDWLRAQGFVS